MSHDATLAPIDAPSPASRPFQIALALAFSRLGPLRRLELEPAILEAFERRAELLRDALRPPNAGEALVAWHADPDSSLDATAGLLATLPAFAVAIALEESATGAPVIRRAHDLATPFRAELYRLDAVLGAARLPPPPARPSRFERKRQADALRKAFGLPRRVEPTRTCGLSSWDR